jgi:hypothetical protein
MPAVDAGGGWLISALPSAEVAFHPADKNDAHELYLMCDDLQTTVEELQAHAAGCDGPPEQGWGITAEIHLPGGGHLGLNQPKRPMAVAGSRED